jgi:hypothetical protein
MSATFTKVALIGLVEERYRLLARAQTATTAAPPQDDITLGLLDACAEIERVTGWRLMRSGRLVTPEQADGAGVDAVALSTSVGGPLRLLTTGPGRDALAGLIYRSIGGLFVQPEPLPPAEASGDDPQWRQLVAHMRAQHPHAILVVGAPSGGIRAPGTLADSAQAVAHWLTALRQTPSGDESARPLTLPVVFTGNTDDAMTLAGTLRSNTPMVHTVEPLSPASLAPLNRVISALYDGVVLRDVPGYAKLRGVSATPATAAATSLGGVVRFLSQQYQMTVVGADVGASATMLCAATAQGEFLPAALTQGGVGSGAGYILRGAGVANITRWLTLPADENTVREFALTRMLRPRGTPSTPLELELEYAFAREAIRLARQTPGSRLSGLNPIDVILGTGGVLSHVPHPALAALILLDALQPRGITSIVLDTVSLATMLGTVAQLAPEIAAEVTESDAVSLLLGSAISVAGMPTTGGEPAVRVVLDREDGSKQIEEVPPGAILRLPLAPGERALLSLYPASSCDVGLGPGQQARASEPIEGGALGLIVDARGRPLGLPATAAERISRLAEWQRALGIGGATGVGAGVNGIGREAGRP